MKKVLALTLISCAAMSAGTANAESAEIRVTGKIVPDACQASFSNGGNVDYNLISSDKLKNDQVTKLEPQRLSLNVTCNAASKVSIKMTDNRSGTAVGGVGDGYDFGLGGKNTGSYTLELSRATSDGNAATVLTDTSGDGTWTNDISSFKADGSFRKSFATGGATTPGAYTTVTTDIVVIPVINKLSELDIGQGIDLDGSATLELAYL